MSRLETRLRRIEGRSIGGPLTHVFSGVPLAEGEAEGLLEQADRLIAAGHATVMGSTLFLHRPHLTCEEWMAEYSWKGHA